MMTKHTSDRRKTWEQNPPSRMENLWSQM